MLAVVWHYWIAVPIAALALILLIATVAGYLKKVTAMRYPDKR